MEDDIQKRLEWLEAQVKALTNLTLSHIVASDRLVEGQAIETIEQAAVQRDAGIGQRQSVHLNIMLDSLREVCDLPPEPL